MRSASILIALVASCGFAPSGPGNQADANIDGAPDAPSIDATDAPPASDGRAACPMVGADGYFAMVGGSRYSYRPTAQNLDNANADCVYDLLGRTHLATFENGDLDAVLQVLSPGTTAAPFVGAVCSVSGACDQRTNWRWVTGGNVADGLWGIAQPDVTTNTIGVARYVVSAWVLDDDSRLSVRPYICECEP